MLEWLSPSGIADAAKRAAGRLQDSVDRFTEEWLLGWTPNQIPDLSGKVALVTGGNSGMGFETCRKLAENGARVYMVSRDLKRGEAAAADIRQAVGQGADVRVMECDLSDMSNVLELITDFKRTGDPLHILVLMAGVYHPGPYAMTPDGIEQTLAVNYYSHALLALGLWENMVASGAAAAAEPAAPAGAPAAAPAGAGEAAAAGVGVPPRIVAMSSEFEALGPIRWDNMRGDKFRGSGLLPYCTSKALLLAFMKELAARLHPLQQQPQPAGWTPVDVMVAQPGLVSTPLFAKADKWGYPLTAGTTWALSRLFGQSPYKGAWSTMYAATAPELAGKGFGYYGPSYTTALLWPTYERHPLNPAVNNPVACWRVFEESVSVLKEVLGPRDMPTVPLHPEAGSA